MKSYDYSRYARLALRGADRVRFLHGMVTCNVEKLATGGGSRAAMLSVKGRLLAELVVYALEDELLLTMDETLGDKVRTLLDKHIVMDDVELVDRSHELAEFGLYGDDTELATVLGVAAGSLAALAPFHHIEAPGLIIARDLQLGAPGVRVLATAGTFDPIGDAMSEDEREAMRVETGTARYGSDLDEERLIVEANLEDALSFDKGCYLGQEVVVRATSRGRVNRRLVGLVMTGDSIVSRRTSLTSDAHADAGVTMSSVLSTRMGGPIALAYVHRSALDANAPLTLDGGRKAMVVELPFTVEKAATARAAL